MLKYSNEARSIKDGYSPFSTFVSSDIANAVEIIILNIDSLNNNEYILIAFYLLYQFLFCK